MTAALFAQEAGAKVLHPGTNQKLGVATQYFEGVIYAAGTSVRRTHGVEDNSQAMFDYIMTLMAWQTRPDIIKRFAERSGMTIEWLVNLGTKYD
jgi:fumarate reductase flavoprotein subunit